VKASFIGCFEAIAFAIVVTAVELLATFEFATE
jgi:hypothetical protein